MVLDLMLIAVAIALNPLPVMAFALVVSSSRGVWKGLAFILAWLACLVAVIAIVLGVTDGQPPPPRSPPGLAGIAAKLAIGVALVIYGLHRRHRMRAGAAGASAPDGSAPDGTAGGAPGGPGPEDAPAAKEAAKDAGGLWAAAGLAVLVQPWGMVAAGAVTVLEADTAHWESWLALFGFCLVSSAVLIAAELYIVFAREAAQARLLRLRQWLKDHADQAIVVLCLGLGLYLTAKSIFQLTG
ncbi:GAP family protein [Streptomyces sp. NPDC089922]|uniref:GAP family protein n=1 Tax=unclassified Streptomyces TaxID=2593676 RepID=UPI0034121EA1